MPRRELKNGKQVADWLAELGAQLKAPGNLTLIGSAALLWHAHERGFTTELPEASMDAAPVTDSDPRHPHAERFAEHEADVRYILESPKDSDAELDAELRQRNLSLRVVVKEIPSVFGSFF